MNEEGWAFRSIMWLRSDLKSEQVPIASSDLIAAFIWLLNQVVLIFSIYI